MSSPTNPTQIEPAPLAGSAFPPERQAWYTVGVLTVVSIFAFIDRQILSLLVQPIRRDLGITDTQVSLLLGFSFAIFFTVFAIPLGRLADTRSRRSVLAAGLAGWSLCTTACGLARSFSQMMLFRMGVGMGESTLNPCAYSIITDSFREGRRATALSVYSMGIYIGSGFAFLAGGLIIQFASGQQAWNVPLLGPVRPWQLILLQVGLAGLLFTGLLYTVREPRRSTRISKVPLAEVAAYLSRNRATFACHHLGFAMITLATTAGAAWIPEMFRRNFHWSIPKFGLYFGIEVALFGSLGVVAAGRIADQLQRRGVRDANLTVAAWVVLLALPVNTLLFLAPSGEWAILWLIPGAALASAPYGVAAAALQQILPGHMRSQATAAYLLVINLAGAATGPTLTAVLTQHVFRRDDALNCSLLIVHWAAFAAAAALLWNGRKPFLKTLASGVK